MENNKSRTDQLSSQQSRTLNEGSASQKGTSAELITFPQTLMKRVAVFTSCDSFEGFYGGTFGLDRDTFLRSYRNDFVWEYSQGLCRCGHKVFIYILSYGTPGLHEISDGLYVRFLALPNWLRLVDPIMWRLRNISHGSTIRDQVAYFGYGDGLQAALREDSVDLLYHQEIWTSRFDIIVRKTNIPVVGADHGAVFSDWMAPAKKISFENASALVCQSVEGLNRARNFGGDAVLMFNGVDIDFFSPPKNVQPRPKTVLAVGRLVEEQKRFSDLLRAIKALPDFGLTLVGSGPDENKLKNLVKDLGIDDRVRFTGFISDRIALRQLYQDSGVFVSTSSWEAVALVLLEAMSCAVPVVATRIPSFLDLLTDGKDGVLVPVGAPAEVARAIKKAYESQFQLGAAARATVKARFSSKAVYERLSKLIESVGDNR